VALAGLLVFGVLLWTGDAPSERPTAFWVLAAGCILGELRPVRIFAREDLSETLSTTFAFALLLGFGVTPAVAVLAAGSLVADGVGRRGVLKSAFNVGQYTLALASAGFVILAISGSTVLMPTGRVDGGDLVALMAATGAFFLVNNVLISVVIAVAQGVTVIPLLRRQLAMQLLADGVLLGLAPVVLVVAEHSPALIPLLVVPIVAVHITTRVSLERQREALHDALTGLPNRTLFLDRVRETIRTRGPGVRAAVLLLDLDRFKDVNDTLGHHVGDELLRLIGPRLCGATDDEDVVARLGGDEFAVLVMDARDEVAARAAAMRLVESLADPIVVEDLLLHVEACVGIALLPDDGDDPNSLLQRADIALYVAKEERAKIVRYSAERDGHSRERLTLLGELRHAIDMDQLILHYQPVIELESRRCVAVEALVRWNHPVHGQLPPIEFIPIAERSGLIAPVTEFVLAAAIAQGAAWRASGVPLRIAVNVSMTNLLDLDLPRLIGRLLTDAAIPPDCLELEITESTLMSDPEQAMTVFEPLHEMGVKLAVDDFGTGYSSLAYLRQLPLSTLKIDKSFVGAAMVNENDLIIVRSILDLARNLGLEVIAEGVEDAATAAMLKSIGCRLAQGYHFGRPVPAEQLDALIQAPSVRSSESA
jgi:diguanylate cyclase (GGDEF)-like protein